MSDTRLFTPQPINRVDTASPRARSAADQRNGAVYVFEPNSPLVTAIQVAQVTHRPLLLTGPSGSGKSSVALNVALHLGLRYYEQVITSRTEARDLQYRFDAVRRLNDRRPKDAPETPIQAYVEPGVLWWAFDRANALRRGSVARGGVTEAIDPNLGGAGPGAVVLIDEIDKADPELPDALLVPLGSLELSIEPTGERVSAVGAAPLIIITSNRERDLPQTFVRRCVCLDLPAPDETRLREIALEVVPGARDRSKLVSELVRHFLAHKPSDASTAELLDLVRACIELGLTTESDDFERVTRMTVLKPGMRG